jgi:ribulose kinase
MKAILALDSGTTNVKAILVDRQGNVLARYSVPLSIEYPKSGWVEQSAAGVWEAARKAVEGCLAQGAGYEVVALGIGRRVKLRLLVLSGSAVAVPKSVRRFAAKGWKNTFEQKQDYRSIRFFPRVRFNGC